jgi:hypothetical protein
MSNYDPISTVGLGRGSNPRSRANLKVQPKVYFVIEKRGDGTPWTAVSGPWTFHVASRKADAISDGFIKDGKWPYHGWSAGVMREEDIIRFGHVPLKK